MGEAVRHARPEYGGTEIEMGVSKGSTNKEGRVQGISLITLEEERRK
jgi:hypothetical protein